MLKELATNADSVQAVARVMRLLADPTRLRLLGLLQHQERNVTDLCRALHVPQPSVSHHLGLLRRAGVVTNRRAGKQIYYGLNSEAINGGGGRLELSLPASGPGRLRVQLSQLDAQPVAYRAAAG